MAAVVKVAGPPVVGWSKYISYCVRAWLTVGSDKSPHLHDSQQAAVQGMCTHVVLPLHTWWTGWAALLFSDLTPKSYLTCLNGQLCSVHCKTGRKPDAYAAPYRALFPLLHLPNCEGEAGVGEAYGSGMCKCANSALSTGVATSAALDPPWVYGHPPTHPSQPPLPSCS